MCENVSYGNPRRIGLIPEASDIKVDLHLDQRKKGLLWFSTYTVAFDGVYTIHNPTPVRRDVTVALSLPTSEAIYDDLRFYVRDKEVEAVTTSQGWLSTVVTLEPGEATRVGMAYRSRGVDSWMFVLGKGATQVKNLRVEVTTDFKAIDFPSRTISPSFSS